MGSTKPQNLTTFLHSGSLGDIIYSLPTIRAMGGGRLYVKRALFHDGYDQFDAAGELLKLQPYLTEVLPYSPAFAQFEYDPTVDIDHDLDLARLQPNRGRVHIVRRHADAMGVTLLDWRRPWLTVPDPEPLGWDYSLVQLTPRYRERSRVDWRRVLRWIPRPVFFVGFEKEFLHFRQHVGPVEYLPTANLLEMARAIKGAAGFYCNQSVGLTLAQGMGKPYFLERHPGRTNCLFNNQIEFIL